MTNIERAQGVIASARARGVTDFCVAAGSRNSPLLAVLGETGGVRIHSFVDERSAAFFALGRAKRDGRPVAVVTTSGTAVAELLPATIEAYYSGIPLLLITADRPARFRGTAAPQAIEQEAIFGRYAASEFAPSRPQHINVEFDEPLIDEKLRGAPAASPAACETKGGEATAAPLSIEFRRPLVILSGLLSEHRPLARDFALRLGAPAYAEPLSGLREDPALERLRVTAGERMLGRGAFDGVIRIGNVPSIRFWRDLDESRADLPVVHISALPFTGLPRGEMHPIETLESEVATRDYDERFFALDRKMAAQVTEVVDSEPESELAMMRAISRELPHGTRIYLGNSLPIREWDLVATREERRYAIEANRGANGIDGQLSTFFGWCDPAAQNVAVVGDLTALHDLNAPWIVPQLEAKFRIYIVNNGGGRIFSRVPSLQKLDAATRARLIENVHSLRFDDWCDMWSLRYGTDVVEVLPDLEATRRAWQRYDELWA